MNRLDGFDRLLAEFGEAIGIPEMAFDEDGLCHIRVDEEFPITFRRDDDQHNLVLVGLVAEELPQQLDHELVKDMLATGVEPLRDNGAALGLEPQSGTLILHQTMPLAKINRPLLEEMLGGFILMQKDWSARVAAAAATSPPKAEGQAAGKPAAGAPGKPAAGAPGKPMAGAPGKPARASNEVLGAGRPRGVAGAEAGAPARRPGAVPAAPGQAATAGAKPLQNPGQNPAQNPAHARPAPAAPAPAQAKGPQSAQPASANPRVHPDVNRR
ncbi:type III secretion system chaperone [Cupriavidus sp. AU9028]|uniref:type III secretion system chaperone n=1 Tax=Cupriavidus sp. AU9028 TaxID=2871157 RepID=UPI001C98BA63|nr:type III secretion system chaperone [Cupriavidus sp. AU9028]MBY4897898.1 type III secretion system chaperone [Cupriavidus sp. AU9028]